MSRYSIPILLLDGGLGTSLEDLYNVKFSEKTPLWSGHLLVSSPGTLQKLQSAFAVAGADVILTATYQTSFFGFSKTPRFSGGGDVGYSRDEAEGYMRSAITIARKAINEGGRRDRLLALSLGALGAVLIPSQEFTGAYPAQYDHWKGLYNFHLERIHVFSGDKTTWEQIDIVAFETLPVIGEVRAVREVMGELEREGVGMKKFWISCVFPREDLRLPDGTGVDELVREMVRPGLPQPHAIGINCTKLHLLRPLLAQFEQAIATNPPTSTGAATPHLVIYPDGADNLIYNTATKTWDPAVLSGDATDRTSWDEKLWEVVRDVESRGVWSGLLVGGCCKTTPEHIRGLRRRIDEHAG